MKIKSSWKFFNGCQYKKFLKVGIISIIFLLLGAFFVPSLAQTTKQQVQQNTTTFDGLILFSPMYSTTTYLIDNTGWVIHTWSSTYFPGEVVRWLGNGTILRSIKVNVPGWFGSGGGFQKILLDGTITWDFRYHSNEVLSHHDIMPLPNGNVLLIAWENFSRTEAISAGRNPNTYHYNIVNADHIIEVKQTGPTSGEIVWEWHVWDHLIQDYDSSKANYGVVGDHPELVDINYAISSGGSEWMHTNSIDYNEELDQILISVRYFNEIWVIDHSTTTAEAAGHTGGRSGKGGDLLYRWGNPAAYRAGNASNKKLFEQHDATWIDEGCPGAGNILVFNNGINRPDGDYSSVDEFIPPVDENGKYYLVPGSAYGPIEQTWIYISYPQSDFYSPRYSSAQRLSDGYTLICNGYKGKFFAVNPLGKTLWSYTNPYPMMGVNQVFKIIYIPLQEIPIEPHGSVLECSGSLSWTRIEPGATVTGSFQIRNIGNSSSQLKWRITDHSSWGTTWLFTPFYGENLSPADGQVTVQVSVIAPDEKDTKFEGYIRVENMDNLNDFEEIPVSLTTPLSIQFLVVIFQRFPNALPLLRQMMGY